MAQNKPISDSEDSDSPFLPSEIISNIFKDIEEDEDLNHIYETVSPCENGENIFFLVSKREKKSNMAIVQLSNQYSSVWTKVTKN